MSSGLRWGPPPGVPEVVSLTGGRVASSWATASQRRRASSMTEVRLRCVAGGLGLGFGQELLVEAERGARRHDPRIARRHKYVMEGAGAAPGALLARAGRLV